MAIVRDGRAWWEKLNPSTRWLISSVVLGWVPLFFLQLLWDILPGHRDELAGAGLAYGLWITIPATLLAFLLFLYKIVRLITGD